MTQKSILGGILAMLAAAAAFAVMDAAMKHLVQTYPPLQVASLRGLTSIPFFLLATAFTGRWRALVPVNWMGHLARGALGIIMLLAFIYAVRELSLGTAYGIFLCAPLLLTALSALVLREQVGLHRWFAVACGLIGVIVILNPEGRSMVTLAGLMAFGAALCYAVAALMIRRLARTESTLSIGFSYMLIIAVGTGAAALPGWVPLLGEHWPWIAVLGVSGAVGQYLIVHAFRCAPASVIAPFEYSALLWGITLDWIVWSAIPGARMLAGAGVVIVSGLYVIYREHRIALEPVIRVSAERP